MSQRNHLSFDLTQEQWIRVNEAMLWCFARQAKPDPSDPVNHALAIICREWLVAQHAGQVEAGNRSFHPPNVSNSTAIQ